MKIFLPILASLALVACSAEVVEPDISQNSSKASPVTGDHSFKTKEKLTSPLTSQAGEVCEQEYNHCESSSDCCDDMVCERVGAYPYKVCITK